MRMWSEYEQWKLFWKAAACNSHTFNLRAAFSFRMRLIVWWKGILYALNAQKLNNVICLALGVCLQNWFFSPSSNPPPHPTPTPTHTHIPRDIKK